MDWEQQLQACQAIAECYPRMRKPKDWYIHHSVSVKKGCALEGRYGNGSTPEEAVGNHWDIITNLKPEEYIVINEYGKRTAVKWNGFMWAHVNEEV